MTNKLKKLTAMLLAGLLACTALVGCEVSSSRTNYDHYDDDEDYYDNDYNYNSSSGSNSGNAQQNSQYTGLSPTEIMEALGKAEDYVITSNATMSNNEAGVNQSAAMTVKKDGNYAIMEGSRMDGSYLSDYSTTYIDLDSHTGYFKGENGNWTSEFDNDINWGTLLYYMAYDNDGGAIIEYILDDSNYYSTDTNKHIMREDGLARIIADGNGVSASGSMTKSGATYLFVMTAQKNNTVLNFTITIEFKSTSVIIPNSVRG
ncbi:MAG: hypothetical protein IJX76_07625 [Clostridia bacterium]|nr:hypothetical protein [Clostridia bacterium]